MVGLDARPILRELLGEAEFARLEAEIASTPWQPIEAPDKPLCRIKNAAWEAAEAWRKNGEYDQALSLTLAIVAADAFGQMRYQFDGSGELAWYWDDRLRHHPSGMIRPCAKLANTLGIGLAVVEDRFLASAAPILERFGPLRPELSATGIWADIRPILAAEIATGTRFRPKKV